MKTNLRELCGQIIELVVYAGPVTATVTGRVRYNKSHVSGRSFLSVGDLQSNGCSLPTSTSVRRTGRNGLTYVKD